MFTRFFIDRPIFASVLSILIVLTGGGAIGMYLIMFFSADEFPVIEVSAVYPGMNADAVKAEIANPIERQLDGIEGMREHSSRCSNNGDYSLTVVFQHGIDPGLAQARLQKRLAEVQPRLPIAVVQRGVSVEQSPKVLMKLRVVCNNDDSGSVASNYVSICVRDEISRLPGVGRISCVGLRDRSIHIWPDKQKLTEHDLTIDDVTQAVWAQHIQVASNPRRAIAPLLASQDFITIGSTGRFAKAEEFGGIIVKVDRGGKMLFLRNVARIVEPSPQRDDAIGARSVELSIHQMPGSNSVEIACLVRAKVEEMRPRFPPGIDIEVTNDSTLSKSNLVRAGFDLRGEVGRIIGR